MNRRRHNGFTLIELMIVVVILGLLAALAIPRYFEAVKKSKIAEAKTILKQIWKCDQVYYQEFGFYHGEAVDIGEGLPGMDFDKVSGRPRFVYSIAMTGAIPTYVAEALIVDEGGDASLQGYELQMDAEGNFVTLEPGQSSSGGRTRRKKSGGRRGRR